MWILCLHIQNVGLFLFLFFIVFLLPEETVQQQSLLVLNMIRNIKKLESHKVQKYLNLVKKTA